MDAERELVIPGVSSERAPVIESEYTPPDEPDNMVYPPDFVPAEPTPPKTVDTEPAADPVEAEARRQGWVPKEEFRGDPDKWRPAAEWVERGDKISKLQKNRIAELEARLAKQEKTSEKVNALLAEQLAKKQEELNQALAQVKVLHRAAIREGDDALADQLEDQMSQLNQQKQQLVAEESKTESPVVDPEIIYVQGTNEPAPFKRSEGVEWARLHPWLQDNRLADIADSVGRQLQKQLPHLKGREFLDTLASTVKATYPEFFQQQAQRRSPVATQQNVAAANTRAKAIYDSLPPADKKIAKDLVEKGVYKDVYEFAAQLED